MRMHLYQRLRIIAIDRAESILVKLSKKVDLEKLENIRIILLDQNFYFHVLFQAKKQVLLIF